MWGHEIFEFWAQRHPDAELAVHNGVTTTYGEAAARVDCMAGGFARDLAPGDRFAVVAKNSVDLLLVYLAAFKAGVVPVLRPSRQFKTIESWPVVAVLGRHSR